MEDNGLVQLHDVLEASGIQYWVDSGVLLGLVRSRQLNSWEKDIDLAICVENLEQVIRILEDFRSIGYSSVVNRYCSYVYSIGLKPVGDKAASYLEASIHVFYSVGGYLWSPQPQFHVPAPAPEVRSGRRSMAGRLVLALVNRLFFSRNHAKDDLPVTSVKVEKSWLYNGLYSIYRRMDKRVFVSLWPLSEVFVVFTWLVPADLVLPLSGLSLQDRVLPVPGKTEEYLAYRYGDWKTPRQDWFYWRDDGSIVDAEPLKVRQNILDGKFFIQK